VEFDYRVVIYGGPSPTTADAAPRRTFMKRLILLKNLPTPSPAAAAKRPPQE